MEDSGPDCDCYLAHVAEGVGLAPQERFVQTGVGWVLRELSRPEEGRVIGFVEANLDRFSRESLKNATKFVPPE